jgi:thioredoxin-like negative regulator of GroEL
MGSTAAAAKVFRACAAGIREFVAGRGENSNILVLLITRRTSGVGRRMESVLARLQVRERDRVRVARVDADDRPDLVRRLGVQEIPSIVMVRGRRRLACLKGRTTLGDVERTLSQHVTEEESRAATV